MPGSEELIERLKRLHVDRSHGAPAPHKPLMLLAVLDLVEEGIIEHNRIEYDPRLIERFNDYWSALDAAWRLQVLTASPTAKTGENHSPEGVAKTP